MTLWNTEYIEKINNMECLAPLKKLKQWVVVPHDNKKPYQINGQQAMCNVPETWNTFEACIEEISKNERWAYVAFCFTENDPFCFVDFDEISSMHDKLVDLNNLEATLKLFDSYAELSRSGDGIHILGFGRLESTFWKKYKKFEMYDRNHFCTITCNVVKGFEKLNNIQTQCHAIQRKYKKPKIEVVQGVCDMPISHVYAKINRGHWLGLAEGDSPTGDESSADYSLMCKIGELSNYDPQVMEEVFGMTRRGQRDKWVKRQDYRERTIMSVLGKRG